MLAEAKNLALGRARLRRDDPRQLRLPFDW